MSARQVNLVNDKDEIVGHCDLFDAHRGSGRKHQAISLFLFNQKEDGTLDLLIQQRSEEKIVGAKEWANTVCANLLPGEKHMGCVKRRALEELGVEWNDNWPLEEVAVLDYQVACENGFAENEIDHFFVTILNQNSFSELKISPKPSEVAGFAWISWEAIKKKQLGDKVITPWFDLFLDNKKIIKEIEQTWKK